MCNFIWIYFLHLLSDLKEVSVIIAIMSPALIFVYNLGRDNQNKLTSHLKTAAILLGIAFLMPSQTFVEQYTNNYLNTMCIYTGETE